MSSVITPILGHLSGLAQPVKSVDLTKPAESTSTLTKAVKSIDQTKLAESTCDLTKAVKSGWRQGLFCFDDCTILSTPYCLIMYTLLFANNCGLFCFGDCTISNCNLLFDNVHLIVCEQLRFVCGCRKTKQLFVL